MDRDVIRDFWRQRATSGTTRWTDDAMLLHEQDLLREVVPPTARILDLGSGFGELSLSILPARGSLLAVDQEPGFAAGFIAHQRARFQIADVATFGTDESFDIVLLFGVVTYLDPLAEAALYSTIAGSLAPSGVAVVKNQCSDSESFSVDKYSEVVGSRYVGRYPSVDAQTATLNTVFTDVQVQRYPEKFRVHSDSSHVAFLCRGAVD